VTARFEAFKAALHALCVEHGVRLGTWSYDDACLVVQDADGLSPFDELSDETLGTAEEQEARRLLREQQDRQREEEHQQRHKRQMEVLAEQDAALRARMAEIGWYAAMRERGERDAQEQRKKQMRISKDPADPHYGGPEPRRVRVNDREVPDWHLADEFRRVVIREDGTVVNGSVWIERLPAEGNATEASAPAAPVTDAGFVGGVFVPEPKPEPAVAPAPSPAPQPAPKPARHKHGKRR
jgi:hypothetical protein